MKSMLIIMFASVALCAQTPSEFVIPKKNVRATKQSRNEKKRKVTEEAACLVRQTNELQAALVALEKELLDLLEDAVSDTLKKYTEKELQSLMHNLELLAEDYCSTMHAARDMRSMLETFRTQKESKK